MYVTEKNEGGLGNFWILRHKKYKIYQKFPIRLNYFSRPVLFNNVCFKCNQIHKILTNIGVILMHDFKYYQKTL